MFRLINRRSPHTQLERSDIEAYPVNDSKSTSVDNFDGVTFLQIKLTKSQQRYAISLLAASGEYTRREEMAFFFFFLCNDKYTRYNLLIKVRSFVENMFASFQPFQTRLDQLFLYIISTYFLAIDINDIF